MDARPPTQAEEHRASRRKCAAPHWAIRAWPHGIDPRHVGAGAHADQRADAGRRRAATGDRRARPGRRQRACTSAIRRARSSSRRATSTGRPRWTPHIYAECQLSDRSTPRSAPSRSSCKTGGELSQHLSRVVAPLLIHDLPVVLWWPDDPPFGSRQFSEVVGTADRLLVDSGTFHEDGGSALAGLATVVADGVAVTDIGWLRLTLWRELLAGLFDHPLLAARAATTSAACASTSRGRRRRCASRKARFYLSAGWPRDWAGRSRGRSASARDRGRAARRIPTWPARDHGRAAPGARHARRREARGRLAGARRHRGRAPQGSSVRARVTRQADHLLATADWNGRPGRPPRRTARAVRRDAVRRRGARAPRASTASSRGPSFAPCA